MTELLIVAPEVAAALSMTERRDRERTVQAVRDDVERPEVDGSTIGQWSARPRSPGAMRRQADEEAGRLHVIASVKFGPGRLTTCAANGCTFTATGSTDERMATAWNQHGQSKQRDRRSSGRSGPFTRRNISDDEPDDDESGG